MCPAEDTLRDCFMNIDHLLLYQLTIESGRAGAGHES
jgi:hypothetical protein